MSYQIKIEDVLSKSNGGLEIFKEIFNLKNKVTDHFQIRHEDSTHSAQLSLYQGNWYIKDWGSSNDFYSKKKNAVDAYAHEKALGFFEALRLLASKYGVIPDTVNPHQNLFKKVDFPDFQGKLNADDYEIVTRKFTTEELNILGPLVTEKLCEKLGFYAVESYSWLKEPDEKEGNLEKHQRSVCTKFSSPEYPIFAYIEKEKEVQVHKGGKSDKLKIKEFVKIMQPKDLKFRFRYFGHKGSDHIFGLDYVKSLPKPIEEKKVVDEETGEETYEKVEAKKHKRIFIGSGERDSLNIASLDAPVVWFNSETANVKDVTIKTLYTLAEEIINIPDIDTTGIEAANNLALNFIDMKTVWLPTELAKKYSWKNKPLKDFTDYIKELYNPDDENNQELFRKFNALVDNARPAKFWEESRTYNAKGVPYGPIKYYIHYLNAFHFLKLNGFFRVRDPHDRFIYYFVKQENHVVRKVDSQEIKSFFIDFLKLKQKEHGTRYYPDELINMLYGSEAVSDKKLASLELKEFDFTDNTEESQFLFFDEFTWEISKTGIKEIRKGYDRHVFEENILNNIIEKQWKKKISSKTIKIEDPYVKIWKDKEGNWDIKILEENCDFINYMINTSRVHWKAEKEKINPEDQDAYFNKYKFSLDGGLLNEAKLELGRTLSPDQIFEQKLHFINKWFAFGYMLHSYKKGSNAWLVYAMDNEVSEEGKSEGRTGKSLMWHRAMFMFKNSFYIGSRNPKIIDNEFLFGGVTEQTKYILFDDAHRHFQFNRLFTYITGDLNVNVKNRDAFVISFFKSAKIAYSTNFAPMDLDDSSRDRILFVAYSDWYHGPKENLPEHKPMHDFGYEFFTGWNQENGQWNKFINACAQSAQFFMTCDEKIGAPESNIRLRNLKAEMTESFFDWALDYFTEEKLNTDIRKLDAFDELKKQMPVFSKMKPTEFKNKIKKYCEYSGYIFNPVEMITDHQNNRIIRGNSVGEVIFIKTIPEENKTKENNSQTGFFK